MNVRVVLFATMAGLLTMSTPVFGQGSRSEFFVLLLASDELPESSVARARAVATEAYSQIGIDVRWVDNPRSLPLTAGKLWRRLVLLPRAPKEFGAPSDAILGSTPRSNSDPGCTAYVFVDAVLKFARKYGVSVGALLGYVMAHELGHSLLPTGGHASGVMNATWSAAEIAQIRNRTLAFELGQSGGMRRYIAAVR